MCLAGRWQLGLEPQAHCCQIVQSQGLLCVVVGLRGLLGIPSSPAVSETPTRWSGWLPPYSSKIENKSFSLSISSILCVFQTPLNTYTVAMRYAAECLCTGRVDLAGVGGGL